MTTVEIRIDGTIKRIEKIIQKIARLKTLIEKKKQKIASGKEENNKYPNGKYCLAAEIEWHEDDIKRAEKDLLGENKKLTGYKEIRKSEVKRDSLIPHVDAVEKFLGCWKKEAKKYYNNELLEIEPFMLSVKTLKYEERVKKINNRFTKDVLFLNEFRGKDQLEKIEKLLTQEVNRKRIDLYSRCSEKVGLITDATGLYIGHNLSLNGFVIGEKGKVEVETIFAGGYNIQCLHYRVLIK